MNIFVISNDTLKCAQALDDLRLNKMIVETAQLLSTAMRVNGYKGDDIYKETHRNHPCAVWARESMWNYSWLLIYMLDLIKERKKRTGKDHKSYEIFHTLCSGLTMMLNTPMTPFVNCSMFKDDPTFEAYKLTLKLKWNADKRPAKWTNSEKPIWA